MNKSTLSLAIVLTILLLSSDSLTAHNINSSPEVMFHSVINYQYTANEDNNTPLSEIRDDENELIIDRTITIRGIRLMTRSITVKSGGELILDDATLIFVTYAPRMRGIRIEPGGKLTSKDSIIKPLHYSDRPMSRYYIWIEGDAEITNTEVIAPWGGSYSTKMDFGGGIFCKGGEVKLNNVKVVESMVSGITIRENTKAELTDCEITGRFRFTPYNKPINMFGMHLLNFGNDAYSEFPVTISGGKIENTFIAVNSQAFRGSVSKMTFVKSHLIDINIIQGTNEKGDERSRHEDTVSFYIYGDNKYSYTADSRNLATTDFGPKVIIEGHHFTEKDTGRYSNIPMYIDGRGTHSNIILIEPGGDFRKALDGYIAYQAVYDVNLKIIEPEGISLSDYSLWAMVENITANGTFRQSWTLQKDSFTDIPEYSGFIAYYKSFRYYHVNETDVVTVLHFNNSLIEHRIFCNGSDGKRYYGDFVINGHGNYIIEMKIYKEPFFIFSYFNIIFITLCVIIVSSVVIMKKRNKLHTFSFKKIRNIKLKRKRMKK